MAKYILLIPCKYPSIFSPILYFYITMHIYQSNIDKHVSLVFVFKITIDINCEICKKIFHACLNCIICYWDQKDKLILLDIKVVVTSFFINIYIFFPFLMLMIAYINRLFVLFARLVGT